MSDRRTTLARAVEGFDPKFETALVDAITAAIADKSIVTDQSIMAIRTGETIGALVTVRATVLAMCPDSDVPSRLREMVNTLAKRIRRRAAQARAMGVGDILGAGREGHA